MKKAAIIGILCIVLGFGAGWLARRPDLNPPGPSASSKVNQRPDSSPTGRPPVSGDGEAPATASKTGRPPAPGDSRIEPSEEIQKLARKQQESLRQNMLARQADLHRARISKLVDALGLTAGQEAQLRKFFQANRDKLSALLAPERANDWTAAMETAALVRADGLDDLLGDMLDAGQEASYQELKATEHQTELDQLADKKLTTLENVVELTAEQKESMRDLLRNEADRELKSAPDASALIAVWEDAIGIQMDPGGLGLAQAFQSQLEQAAEADSNPADPTSWMSTVKDKLDQRIQEKVHRLGNVLTGPQQVAYRQHLEMQTKALGIFQHMRDPNAELVGPK